MIGAEMPKIGSRSLISILAKKDIETTVKAMRD